jgi:hypothetical protein
MLRVLALSLVVCCALYMSASAVQNAGPTWNDLCAQYNFHGYPVSATYTFGDAYYGSDFDSDIVAITKQLNRLLVSVLPPPENDDMLNITLENWPERLQ